MHMSILCLKFQVICWANPATNDRMLLYYFLMTEVDGLLGSSTVFYWVSCHSWYQRDCMHQSLVNNHNHMISNKIVKIV
jgi:hypothetical protein